MVSAPWRAAAGAKINDRHAVMIGGAGRPNWLIAIRRYLVAMTLGNLVWETAQMPLYTLWQTGTPVSITAAVFHCMLGDVAIGTIALVLALALLGAPGWPDEKFRSVLTAVVLGGLSYTIYSEYTNTVLRASWAYTAWMPTVPVLGTGIAPLAQWMVIPVIAVAWAARRSSISTRILLWSRHAREHGCGTSPSGNGYKRRA
jgi:hypothetical protein